MQMGLFEANELLEGDELEIHEAKVFTAKNIFRSAGIRKQMEYFLSHNDKGNAYKVFNKAFRNYGFGFPNSYGFFSYRGNGEIRYYKKEDHSEQFVEVKSDELFDLLLENIYKE